MHVTLQRQLPMHMPPLEVALINQGPHTVGGVQTTTHFLRTRHNVAQHSTAPLRQPKTGSIDCLDSLAWALSHKDGRGTACCARAYACMSACCARAYACMSAVLAGGEPYLAARFLPAFDAARSAAPSTAAQQPSAGSKPHTRPAATTDGRCVYVDCRSRLGLSAHAYAACEVQAEQRRVVA